ncbi:hypothetical protein I6N90_04970 [Paenibacillus sp. GSMTC-2017]|uniref:hypothetical protein n=1 Tax=Paenibacillus sp. GSMTC-2017 TaxID=2794350 RepID=UPI0018D7BF7F|nr:hypothetical protein [Paenibacillus sp. GSMTC-2017]MBH5317161.1 hypothetical protein [Paenibacillus sp. GSMTC-2017]
MNPNNRITYRFDHKGKQVAKQVEKGIITSEKVTNQAPINNVVPLYSTNATNLINEIHPWDNSYQDELGALEQLIRESGQHTSEVNDHYISNKRGNNVTDTTTPLPRIEINDVWNEHWSKQQPYVEKSIVSSGKRFERSQPFYDDEILNEEVQEKNSNGPSWFNVFLSVAAALATGVLFGYLILSLFVGGDIWPSGNQGDESTPVTSDKSNGVAIDEIVNLPLSEGQGDKSGGQAESSANGESKPATSISFGGANYSYILLQYGVFSQTVGRDEAIKQLQTKGIASASTQVGEKFPVYAGIASDSTEATTLVAQLPGLEVYKKEVVVQLPDKLTFSGSKNDATRYFEGTNDLIASWSSLINAQLEQVTLSPLSEAASSSWQQKFKQWRESAALMKEGTVDKKGIVYLNKLNQSIENAATSMLDYDKQTKKSHLWTTQSELMNAVLSQKEWFESMSAL